MPLPRKPSGDLLRLPGRVRARRRPGPRGAAPTSTPTWSSGSAATSRCPPTWAPAAGCRSSCTRRTPGPGWRTRSAPGSPPGSPPPCPAAACPAPRSSASRCAARSPRWTARACGPRPAQRFGLPADGPVLLVFGGSQGARTLNTARRRGAARAAPTPGSPCCTRTARAATPGRRRVPGYVPLPYIDDMHLAYAAADAVLGRAGAMTVAEVSAVGPARGLRAAPARQRRAGAQRRARRRGGRRGAGRRRRADRRPACSPSCVPLLTDPAAAGGDGRRRAGVRATPTPTSGWPAMVLDVLAERARDRRRPAAATPTGRSSWPTGCTSSASAAPG